MRWYPLNDSPKPEPPPTPRPPTKDDLLALYRLWAHLPRVFRRVITFTTSYDSYTRNALCSADQANIITSEVANSTLHAPVLDIDIPCALIPSSTPGHFHLLIEKPLSWRGYRRLLKALGRAGIVEHQFVKASLVRGYSSVRVPWVKKAREQ